MKAIVLSCIIIHFMLFTGNLYGQVFGVPTARIDTAVFSYLEHCGSDSDPVLNQSESAYLNVVLSTPKRPYNFNNKKIAFVTGSSSRTISDK